MRLSLNSKRLASAAMATTLAAALAVVTVPAQAQAPSTQSPAKAKGQPVVRGAISRHKSLRDLIESIGWKA